MRYYIISGEASGDLHGSNLIKELHHLDANASIQCWGGEKMEAAGAKLVKHYRDLAFMGFVEVIKNLPTILNNIKFCKQDIVNFNPDALILIDYPGFNLRIAKWAKQQGIKVIYYISPQVWAWKENRVKMMKQCIDKMICILPFEKNYYQNKWNWLTEYAGHPLTNVIDAEHEKPLEKLSDKKIIALLPGSRQQEILKKLPVMLEVAKHFKQYQFIVAKAPGIDESFYNNLLAPYSNVSWVVNKTYTLLRQSKAAIVTSGTATLETALFNVPEVVCYKGNPISYQIAKRIITIKYICLVNLIMDKPVVKELIQNEMNEENIQKELELILHNDSYRRNMLKNYSLLKEMLQGNGNASVNAAHIIYEFIKH